MDKNMIADLESLPESDKARMSTLIEQLQIRDSLFLKSLLCMKIPFQVHSPTLLLFIPIGSSCSNSSSTRVFVFTFFNHFVLSHFFSTTTIILTNDTPLRMYNSLVERCFTDCVDTFQRKSLTKQEETCVRRCAEKFLKHSMRVGMRFAELNQGAPTTD
uniref:Tim10-like domain-containing protein n=1 Tax=Quercus lobata TaxID=97700 RepID=A0A7N2M7F5_QUELO